MHAHMLNSFNHNELFKFSFNEETSIMINEYTINIDPI